MSIKEAILQQKPSKFNHNQKGRELIKIFESFHHFKKNDWEDWKGKWNTSPLTSIYFLVLVNQVQILLFHCKCLGGLFKLDKRKFPFYSDILEY